MKKFLGLRNRRDKTSGKKQGLALIAVLLCVCVVGQAGCTEFERAMWQGLRGADATVESLTSTYEKWRDEQPRQFTDAEVENLRVALSTANEAVAAGEGAYSAYWEAKKSFAQGAMQDADFAAKRAALSAAVEAAKRAAAAARQVFDLLQGKRAAPVQQAGVDFALLVMLLGQLATAFLGGKKARIAEAALDLIAHVMDAVKQATGEDIELGLTALRARVGARRKRLAKR